jgi:hypothetical protein
MASRWKQTLGGLALLAGVGAVVLWATGAFRSGSRIGPGREPAPRGEPPPQRTARAARQDVEVFEDAVGRCGRGRGRDSAQVSAQVLDVALRPGAPVKVGTPLVLSTIATRGTQGPGAAGRRGRGGGRPARDQAKAQAEARAAPGDVAPPADAVAPSRTVTPELAEAAEATGCRRRRRSRTAGRGRGADAQRPAAAQVVAWRRSLGTRRSRRRSWVVSERSVEPATGVAGAPARRPDPDALRLEARVREAPSRRSRRTSGTW